MNYYDILKVSKTASQKEIRDSYKSLIKKYHPDIYTGSHEYAEKITKDLNDAYKVLSNEEARREYDLSLNNEITTEKPVYSPYTYKTNRTQNYEYEETIQETFEQKMKKRIYNVVDEKTSRMSAKSKFLLIIGVMLFALLCTIFSIFDFIKIMNMPQRQFDVPPENSITETNTVTNEITNQTIQKDGII